MKGEINLLHGERHINLNKTAVALVSETPNSRPPRSASIVHPAHLVTLFVALLELGGGDESVII